MLGCSEPSTDDGTALGMALAMIRNADSKSTADNLEYPTSTKEDQKKSNSMPENMSHINIFFWILWKAQNAPTVDAHQTAVNAGEQKYKNCSRSK